MNADREAQHDMTEARQAVGADAQVGGIVAAIAQIRKAALAAAELSSGAGWYLGGDLSGVLCDEDAALLVACEPVRLLEILALAEVGLGSSSSESGAPIPCHAVHGGMAFARQVPSPALPGFSLGEMA